MHTVLLPKSPTKTHIAGKEQLHATCKANFAPLSTPKAVASAQSSSPEIHLKACWFEHMATCIASNASLGSSRSWAANMSLYAVSTPGHLCKHSGLGRCKRRTWTPKSAWKITTKSWPTTIHKKHKKTPFVTTCQTSKLNTAWTLAHSSD